MVLFGFGTDLLQRQERNFFLAGFFHFAHRIVHCCGEQIFQQFLFFRHQGGVDGDFAHIVAAIHGDAHQAGAGFARHLGLGGFFLPSLLGVVRELTGTYAGGFVVLAMLCFWGMSLMVAVSGGWRRTWAARDAFEDGAEESLAWRRRAGA